MAEDQDAKNRLHILVQALSTEQSRSFFGVPPIQSGLLPIAVPEVTLYKAQYQTGYTRFRLDIFETATGKFTRSTPWFQASTYCNEYTILVFIDFHTTNLIAPFSSLMRRPYRKTYFVSNTMVPSQSEGGGWVRYWLHNFI